MTSILSSFRSVSTALQQDQIALTATADNISNQNSAGYARRAVSWQGGDTVTLTGGVAVQPGLASVSAQRSAVLDRAVVDTSSNAASASTLKRSTDALQALFAVDGSGDEGSGLNAAMSQFFSAMQAIAADPASTTARQSGYAAARTVADRFHAVSAALSQQSSDLDGIVQQSVPAVNQLTASIAALNEKLSAALSTADRDAIQDQRSAQVQALSALVGIQQTANSDGSVSLYTTSGGALVVGGMHNAVSTAFVSGGIHLYTGGMDITDGLEGGSIGGALVARSGILADSRAQLGQLAMRFADAANAANAGGVTATGTAGQAIFAIPPLSPDPAKDLSVVAAGGEEFAMAASGEGSGGNGNGGAFAQLPSTKDSSGRTFAGALADMLSGIGTAAANASLLANSAASAQTVAAGHQQDLSGVSLDTEAANLTQYQRSYQAEAKLLAILNQVMAESINLGTNTAVS